MDVKDIQPGMIRKLQPRVSPVGVRLEFNRVNTVASTENGNFAILYFDPNEIIIRPLIDQDSPRTRLGYDISAWTYQVEQFLYADPELIVKLARAIRERAGTFDACVILNKKEKNGST